MEEIIIIFLCLLTNALLACVEMAFVTTNKSKLKMLSRQQNRHADLILKLRKRPERTLSIIQVGITLVGAISAAVGGVGAEESISPLFERRFNMSESTAEFTSIILVVIPLTYLNVVLGELVPKTLALKNPLWISLNAARWLDLLDRILFPLITFLEFSTKKIMKLFAKRPNISNVSNVSNINEEEHDDSSNTVELDDLSHPARDCVVNLVKMEKKRIRHIYLPWEQVISINENQSVSDVESIIVSSGHTRLPVVSAENTVSGTLNTKEFMSIRHQGITDWKGLIRPFIKVQVSSQLLKTLKIMQEKRAHLAIVYQQENLMGIVTMEDILEEVIGDVYDEDDDSTLVKRVLGRSTKFNVNGTSIART